MALKEPKDLVFTHYKTTLRFAAWHMAYDKGAGAGIQIQMNEPIGDTRDIDPNDVFCQNSKAVLQIQRLVGNLSHQDLLDLAEWAKKSAAFMKKAEIKYRGKENFEKSRNEDSLKVQ